jgi:hypothetical protein
MRANTISENDARGKLEKIRFTHFEVVSTREKSWESSEEVACLALVDWAGYLCHA